MFFFFQAEDGIRDRNVTGVQTCALPICFRRRDVSQIFQNGRANYHAGSHPCAVDLSMVDRLPTDGLEEFRRVPRDGRSEEHTSELQSRFDLVCRLLLEKKKKKKTNSIII